MSERDIEKRETTSETDNNTSETDNEIERETVSVRERLSENDMDERENVD